MKNSLSKIARKFQLRLAQQAPDITPEQLQVKIIQNKLTASLPKVKAQLMEFLALKNDSDIQLSGMYTGDDKTIHMAINFPNNLQGQVYRRLMQNRKDLGVPAPEGSGFLDDLKMYTSRLVSNANANIKTSVDNIFFV